MRAIVLFGAVLALGSCQQQSAEEQMQAIHDKVAEDAVEQYEMVDRSGSPVDKCVQAGMVSAAYLQAKRDDQYRVWKATERLRCIDAGVQQ